MASYHPAQPGFYDSLLESQYWPAEKRRDAQRANLQRMLRHARANVPFYEKRLDVLFTQHGEIDWDHWINVPIVTRADLVERRDTMLAPSWPTAHGRDLTATTSGSAGPPITVSHTTLGNTLNLTTRYRAHRWHGLDWGRDLLFLFGEDPSQGAWPEGKVSAAWGPPWMSASTGNERSLNRFTPSERVLEFIQRNKIAYLSGRTANLHALAFEAERLNSDVHIDAVISFSEGAAGAVRRDIRRQFGAELIVPYSSKEGGQMAHQCARHPHLHINEEVVLLEIVDSAGQPCRTGEVGRVVITPLFNYAQPLIRYEQGDLASFGAPCDCGVTLPVLEELVGRQVNLFRLPGGRRVSMSLSSDLCAAFGAKFWQIAQVAPLRIEVRYVPRGPATGDEDAVAEVIRAKTDPDVEVVFRRQKDIFRPDGRKFIEYVCELPAELL